MHMPATGSIQNESAFRRGKAMSWAPIMIGMTKLPEAGERGDDEQEDHQRRVHREERVVGRGREVLQARRRQLGADALGQHPADDEEDERRHQVLDADHLVVGVDLEVVLPRVRAVVGVILVRRGGVADQVAPPVVPAADADGEADAGEEEQERLHHAVRVGHPSGRVPDQHHQAGRAEAHDGRHPRRPHPAATQPHAPFAAAAVAVVELVGVKLGGMCNHQPPPFRR